MNKKHLSWFLKNIQLSDIVSDPIVGWAFKDLLDKNKSVHCMKNFRIRSFLRSVFYHVWTECRDLLCKSPYSVWIGKKRTKEITYSDTFYAVIIIPNRYVRALAIESYNIKFLQGFSRPLLNDFFFYIKHLHVT